ncbi:MAG TPA: MscL family protein, partial [Syntrophorhabdaceae bacterium]|nr:MscL family protein [Syntrophorhabdaceae bacterium]
AKAAGAVTINYGFFLNTVISFLVVAFCVFMLVKNVNRMKREPVPQEVTTKECQYCLSTIPILAVKCPHCTADLKKT